MHVGKLILLFVVVALAFVVVEREKLFVRDPLGSVTRNGVKEDGAQVFINYNNDVMIENDHAPLYVEIVERGHAVGYPANLKCVHWMMCLTDAYPATLMSTAEGAVIESMDSHAVRFRDPQRGETVVTLR